MIDGVPAAPFSAETLPPHKKPTETFVDVIIENTRRKYGTAKEKVEERIRAEWANESDIVKEKVERRREKGLEILEQRPPIKKKSNIDIDRDKLRAVIGQDNVTESSEPAPYELPLTDET